MDLSMLSGLVHQAHYQTSSTCGSATSSPLSPTAPGAATTNLMPPGVAHLGYDEQYQALGYPPVTDYYSPPVTYAPFVSPHRTSPPSPTPPGYSFLSAGCPEDDISRYYRSYLDNKFLHHYQAPYHYDYSENRLAPLQPPVSVGPSTPSTPPLTPKTPTSNCGGGRGSFYEEKPTIAHPLSETIEKAADGTEWITTTDADGVVVTRVRRSANKKERRRTQSINSAFTNLRDCIPNVPSDTKLSKIKTLRLATSYISYLMELLNAPSEASSRLLSEGFRADLSNSKRSSQQNRIETLNEIQRQMRIQMEKQASRMHRLSHGDGSASRRRSASGRSSRRSIDTAHNDNTSGMPTSPDDEDDDNDGDDGRDCCNGDGGNEEDDSCSSSSGGNLSGGGSSFNYASVIVANGVSGRADVDMSNSMASAKPKCRTGWPQHVWALELKNYDQ